ncbi:type VI secretion system tube protein TssD [Emticicia soli]|uniref:Type VI secretion system tube protein TssD n=1 Tax=Emticicia soli TaxID=2027878 RepID=A0ABW5J6I0_9BACT
MASFSAELQLQGISYRVVSCEYSLHQPTDSRGKTMASVKSGLIKLTLASETSNQHKTLSDWAVAVKKPMKGRIVFHRIDNRGATFKKVDFENGHCVSYREVYTPYTGVASALTVNIGITAEKIIIGNVKHDNLWAEKDKG